MQTLTDDHLERLVKADPPPWTSVAEGHLGKLLIPRVCEFGSFASTDDAPGHGRPCYGRGICRITAGMTSLTDVAGTKNSTLVQEYISGVMTGLGWHEEQASLGSTSALTGLSISRRMVHCRRACTCRLTPRHHSNGTHQ